MSRESPLKSPRSHCCKPLRETGIIRVWEPRRLLRQNQESKTATAAAGGLALTIHRLNINDGRLTIGRTSGNWKPLVLDEVNLEVLEFSPSSNFPFSLSTKVKGGGAIKLDGKAGPINATDASMTPATIKINVTSVDVAATGLANYAPDMAGLISLQGNGETNGNIMKVERCDQGGKTEVVQNRDSRNGARGIQFRCGTQHAETFRRAETRRCPRR